MSQWQRQTVAALRDQIAAMGVRDVAGGSVRDGFDKEFEALRALDREVRANHDEFYSAMLGSNATKNRFTDVLPNEGTRVALQPVNSRGDGDYINANYIDARRLFGLPFVYIATQAPMRNTVFDFWRMVFENNSRFIVMLCSEIEAGKVKSERYWPQSVGASFRVGSFVVTLVDENVYEECTFRVIRVANEDGTDARDVYHLQHTSWPDMSVPRTTSALHDIMAALAQRVESVQYPVVVHCSGGIGRTGVFIAMHVALGLFEKEFPISIPGVIGLLKRCRTGMVDRKDQFHFCYFGVLREMQRMINNKSRAVRPPREANRPTDRALPFVGGGANQQLPAGAVGPRQSGWVPAHAAAMTPAIATSAGVQPTQMDFDDPNRQIQFRGAELLNPYVAQQRQSAWNARHQPQPGATMQRTLYGAGASGDDGVEDQLARMRMLNTQKRGSLGGGAVAAAPIGSGGGVSTTITTTLLGGGRAAAAPLTTQPVPMQQALSPAAGAGGVASPAPQPPVAADRFANL